MEKESGAKFQFKNYFINHSLLELKKGDVSENINISFNPKGLINKNKSFFQLQLMVNIEDENKIINVEINAIANFLFDRKIEENQLNNYFYTNAPALLFPYIRAYISNLTTLSGVQPIILPTLNLSNLREDLKNNTKEENDEC
jgi:preprotein translocase subunit SecB